MVNWGGYNKLKCLVKNRKSGNYPPPPTITIRRVSEENELVFEKLNEENERLANLLNNTSEGPRSRQVPNNTTSRHDSFSDDSMRSDDEDEVENEVENEGLDELKSQIDHLMTLVTKLREDHFELDCRVLECEQYSRRESVVISGIPKEVTHQQLNNTVIRIIRTLGFRDSITPKDISACHRLVNNRNSMYPPKVIVKFTNRKLVDFCFTRKDQLPKSRKELDMNLRFFQSLASLNQEALRICKYLQENEHIHEYFLRNGFVKVKIAEGDAPRKVRHPDILREKFDVPNDID